MTTTVKTYPLYAVRSLILQTQGLSDATEQPDDTEHETKKVLKVIENLGCLQIDSISVVNRSQYLAVWSRLGQYDKTSLDLLLGTPGSTESNREVFEYWLHEACIVPLSLYRFLIPKMESYKHGAGYRHRRWLKRKSNRDLMKKVYERVQHEGPLRSTDFESGKKLKRKTWQWRPEKMALEQLYNQGDLMIAGRQNFHRVYDLKERVLPEWVDTTEPSTDEALKFLLERMLKAQGACTAGQLADCVRMRRTTAKPLIESLVKNINFTYIATKNTLDNNIELLVHANNLQLLEKIESQKKVLRRTVFLTPFDSIFWPTGRDISLWGFKNAIEAYKPVSLRKYGYFSLPIFHKGMFVGRCDPKLDRNTNTLTINSIHFEDGVKPNTEMLADIANTIKRFSTFHFVNTVRFQNTNPRSLCKKIEKLLL